MSVRFEVMVWRAPAYAPRLVLWGGGRELDVQVGSRADRLRVLEQDVFSSLWRWPRMVVAGSTRDLRRQVAEQLFGRQVVEAHAMPERDAADAEKLRAYSGARGWSPEDGDQA